MSRVAAWTEASDVVGTHFPEQRDILESGLQRMREAFDRVRDGSLSPGHAEDVFNAGYDEVRDVLSTLLLARTHTRLPEPEAGGLPPLLREHGAAALAVCRDVLHAVTETDLGRATPCADYTVADLGEHLERSITLLAGSAGTHLPRVAGLTLAERIVPMAESTLAAWDLRGVQGLVPLGSRTLPAEQVYDILLLELVLHGWDLYRALGAVPGGFDPPVALVEHLLRSAEVLITPDRRGKAFGPAVPVAAGATPLESLVAFSGRRP